MSNNFSRTIDNIITTLCDVQREVKEYVDEIIAENNVLVSENLRMNDKIEALEEQLSDYRN